MSRTDQELLEIAVEKELQFKHVWDIPTKTVNLQQALSLTSRERRRLRDLLWAREMKQQMNAHPSTDSAYWESLAWAFDWRSKESQVRKKSFNLESIQRGLDPNDPDNRVLFLHYANRGLLTIQIPEHLATEDMKREIRTAKFVTLELERLPVGQPPIRVTFDDGSEAPFAILARYEDFPSGVPTKETLCSADVQLYVEGKRGAALLKMSPAEIRKRLVVWGGPAKTGIEEEEGGYREGSVHHAFTLLPSRNTYWWVAINQSSAAVSPVALPATLSVTPIPKLLVGFRTREEAEEQAHYLLTAPIADVHERIKEFAHRAGRGELAVIKPTNPMPPGKTTHWGDKDK